MILSKRERYIAITALVGLGTLVLYYFLFGPLIEQRAEVEREYKKQYQAKIDGLRLRRDSVAAEARWKEMKETGGLMNDPESQIMRAVAGWADAARIGTPTLKSERTEQPTAKKPFLDKTIRVTAPGNMRSISNFLWQLQGSNIPVRVAEIQLNANKPGTDDLQMQVLVSTILWQPEYEKPAKAAVTPAAREDK